MARGTFSEIDFPDELHHDLRSMDGHCNEITGCAEAGIGSAYVGVYHCGFIELIRVRRIVHCELNRYWKGKESGARVEQVALFCVWDGHH